MTDTWAGLRPHRADSAVPWWYERIVGAIACAVVGFGLSGLVLALIGWFRIGPGLAIGFALTYSLYAQWFRLRERQRLPQRHEAAAALAALISLLSLVFNWTAAGETYLTDTESGVMVNAARHLDTDGSLTVDAAEGPFADARVGFVADGFTGSGVGGTLRSDVPHLVPVYRGIAGWFGQTPLLAAGALFGAAALLALYWLAVRFVSPWAAVAVTAVVAVTMPFVYAARLFLPEVVVLFCLLAALGLLWGQSETRDLWRGAIVGLLGGMAVLARPEWAVVGIAVGLFVVSELVESTRLTWLAGRNLRRFLGALVGGFAVPVVLSVADASRTSVDLPRTFEPQRALTVVLLAAAVFGVLRLSGRALGEQPRLAYADVKRAFAFIVAGGLIVGSIAMLLRPTSSADEASSEIATVQLIEGVDVDPSRSYDESTGWWLVWYLGPLGLAFGVGGLVLLTVGAAEAEARRTVPFLGVALILGVVAIIDAGSVPIQAEGSRRLLVMAIPALGVGAAVAFHRLAEVVPAGPPPWPMAVAALTLVVGLVPLFHLMGVADLSSHRGLRAGIAELCDEIDRTDAVLFVEDAASTTGAVAVQTVRGFCQVPAARAIEPSAAEVEALAAAWRSEGRTLVLISEGSSGRGGVEVSLAWESLERTVESRPDDAAQNGLVLHLSPAE